MLCVKGRIKLEQRCLEEGDALVEEGLEMLSELGLSLSGLSVGAQFTYRAARPGPRGGQARVQAAYAMLKAAGETGIFSTMAGTLAWICARRGALDEADRLSPRERGSRVEGRRGHAGVLAGCASARPREERRTR